MWLDALTALPDTLTMTGHPQHVPCACWASTLVVRQRHAHRVQLASMMMTSTRWYRRQAHHVQTVLSGTIHHRGHQSALTVLLATLTPTTTLRHHVMEEALCVQQARTQLVERPHARHARLVRWTWMQIPRRRVRRVKRVGTLLPLRRRAFRVWQGKRTWTKIRLQCAQSAAMAQSVQLA